MVDTCNIAIGTNNISIGIEQIAIGKRSRERIIKNSKVKIMYDKELSAFELNEAEKPYSIRHRCFYLSKEIIFFVKDCRYDKDI